MLSTAQRWQKIAQKWRGIAERRSAHHVEMFYSGRWRHYYSDEDFLLAMRSAILMAKRWAAIAPDAQTAPAEAVVHQQVHLPKAA
jgi:uncharacterized repeat protein (TIGR03809 family)